MASFNNNNLKIAIQKKGRLTDDTVNFLRKSGLEFEEYKRNLFSVCRNFPLEILYVRDDDIPDYVESGTVDLGILGQNIINEEKPKAKKLFNLSYGFCSLIVAVPKESNIDNIKQLKGKKIATAYPESTKKYFRQNKIPVEIVTMGGSLEITPALGVADAIVDLTSTGSTLALNDLRIVAKVYDSEAVLIANENIFKNGKKELLAKLIMRFNGVLGAKDYKYIMMNVPASSMADIQKTVPGLKSPTITPLAMEGWVSVQTVIKEDVFWETIERLKKCGATGIVVLPIEKMIL